MIWYSYVPKLFERGITSLTIRVTGQRELKNGTIEPICEGTFTFVTVEFEDERKFKSIPHELEL